jgi:hypothetical protein
VRDSERGIVGAVSDVATIIKAMQGWSRQRVTVEVRLLTGERVAAFWGTLELSGVYEFGGDAEAEGELHFRVGDGEFSIDPEIVTGVSAPVQGEPEALVIRLHANVELTVTGP